MESKKQRLSPPKIKLWPKKKKLLPKIKLTDKIWLLGRPKRDNEAEDCD